MNYLVTGCSRGVGLEICKVLLEEGHRVFGIARSHSEDFKTLENQYNELLHFKSVDLSDSENVRQLIFKEYISNDIVLDGYVNNAAIAYDDIITNLNLSKLKAMYAVNVFTPMMITKYVLRNMILHHTKGSIVHISSISAHTGYKGLAMYASSKGAIEAFSKDTAREWGEKDRIYKRTSLKAATSPQSVAETTAFLLSSKACSITGQDIHVDNGTI